MNNLFVDPYWVGYTDGLVNRKQLVSVDLEDRNAYLEGYADGQQDQLFAQLSVQHQNQPKPTRNSGEWQ